MDPENLMLKDNIVKLLNEQITHEAHASQLYLQMSLWCEDRGMNGAAAFFRKHVREELDHRDRIVDYMIESDAPVKLEPIPAPPHEWDNLVEVLEAAYTHEREVTAQIHTLAELAMDERDFNTFNMLQWFIAEQREEIVLFRGIVEHMEMVDFDGERGQALVNMDRYLRHIAEHHDH